MKKILSLYNIKTVYNSFPRIYSTISFPSGMTSGQLEYIYTNLHICTYLCGLLWIYLIKSRFILP